MSVAELALRGALCHSGVHSLTPEDNESTELSRGKPVGLIEDCAAYINAALQELADEAPALFKSNGGGYLRAPLSITGLTATEGSTTISGFSAYLATMRGCTIRIGNDAYDNEIKSATELVRPYAATGGAALSGVVYFDCIPLDSSISQIVEPVMIPGLGIVHLANSRTEFLTGNFIGPHERDATYVNSFPYAANFTKMTGRPVRWMCEEGDYSASNAATVLLLRFYPMPMQAYPVVFQKVVKPPTYTAADIDNDDGGADPGTVIPFAWAESRLMPILTRRWMKHPSFGNPDARDEIRADSARALASLEKEKPTRGYTTFVYTNR